MSRIRSKKLGQYLSLVFEQMNHVDGEISFDGNAGEFAMNYPITIAGVLEVPNGTYTTPTLRGAATNSGIYFGSGQVLFSTGGQALGGWDGGGDLNILIGGLDITSASTSGIKVGTNATKVAIAATATRLLDLHSTSALATAVQITSLEVNHTQTVLSAVNYIELGKFVITSAVQLGNWANAIFGKIDLSTTGYVTGRASAISAEIDLPSTNPAGGAGNYCCISGEIGMPHTYTSTVPVSFINMNVWGIGGAGGVGYFEDYGYIFDIQGVGNATTAHIFQENTATAASHALRIRIGAVDYFIMLTSAGA